MGPSTRIGKPVRASRTNSRAGGFTLIELIIVISVIAILMAVAVPVYRIHLVHAHEAVLKQDLASMRTAIDQYTYDKNKAPQDLSDLVSSGYLRAIPKDPFTDSTETWQPVQDDSVMSMDQTQSGINDVHSGSNLMSSDGTAYSSW